jgi:flavin-dependent dehydrogenase
MTTNEIADFDLIVIGGGPAGSSAATFVAMQGHRVLLLEKNDGPTHKVGESLLPATIHGVCPLLGVSDALKQADFISKTGGGFVWGKSHEPWHFLFSATSKYASPTSTAYQVERMKFDRILLCNAKQKGVDVREGHTAKGLLVENNRVVGVSKASVGVVTWRTPPGSTVLSTASRGTASTRSFFKTSRSIGTIGVGSASNLPMKATSSVQLLETDGFGTYLSGMT